MAARAVSFTSKKRCIILFFLCCFLIRANFLSKGHSYSYGESKLDNYLQLLTITDFILALKASPIWQRVVTVCASGENI